MIHDVKITPLKIISDDRGKVMHMLRSDNSIFKPVNLLNNVFLDLSKFKLPIFFKKNKYNPIIHS